MREYKIIVFGSLPIATKIVKYVNSIPNFKLEGVVVGDENPKNNDPWNDELCLGAYAKKYNIKCFTLEELSNNYTNNFFDLGISCRFGKIIKKQVIDLFSKGIVNMHGGLLPEFGGLYSCNYSILYKSKIGGGTIHYIDEGIDTGNILRRCEFDITDNDTGYTVFQKTQVALYENMIELIPKILNNTVEVKTIQELKEIGYECRYFNKNSILEYKEIVDQDFESDNLLYKVRAFDFPGYEPAYYICNGKKIYMRVSSEEDK
ncbi:formyltransferase family protein [Longibaculum muris]|uniref:formyltransferase family protein n=1 Tax=Longibaculum muris TaxID=1796628 RepID=UPI0018A0147F|nr:formyltransferase family protein [Longibaculum muris]